MRKLTANEEKRIATLTANNAEIALLEITETGLKKSIMDATHPLRRLLTQADVHNYEKQGQGQSNKVMIDAIIHGAKSPTPGNQTRRPTNLVLWLER